MLSIIDHDEPIAGRLSAWTFPPVIHTPLAASRRFGDGSTIQLHNLVAYGHESRTTMINPEWTTFIGANGAGSRWGPAIAWTFPPLRLYQPSCSRVSVFLMASLRTRGWPTPIGDPNFQDPGKLLHVLTSLIRIRGGAWPQLVYIMGDKSQPGPD